MHKGIILLFKGDENLVARTEEFLLEYIEDVWDWYVIGGRWSGTLNKKNKEFEDIAKTIINCGDFGPAVRELEDKQPLLQEAWEKIGGIGTNPWNRDSYIKNGYPDDILPLSECIDIVKEWAQDIESAKKEETKARRQWIDEPIEKGECPNYLMYGYSLKCAAQLYKQEFCDCCNVYNTEDYNYSIPENIGDYWAVIIDIHT